MTSLGKFASGRRRQESDHLRAVEGRPDVCHGRQQRGVRSGHGRGVQCLLHDQLLGSLGQGGAQQVRHQGSADDDGPRDDGDAEDGRWPVQEGLERRSRRQREHHPFVDGRSESGGEGAARSERQADRNGVPRADAKRLGRRPDLRPRKGNELRRHHGRSQGRIRRRDEGHLGVRAVSHLHRNLMHGC